MSLFFVPAMLAEIVMAYVLIQSVFSLSLLKFHCYLKLKSIVGLNDDESGTIVEFLCKINI